MQGRRFALHSTKAWMNAQLCSAKRFQSSHLLQDMTRFKIGSISTDVCWWSNFSLICMDSGEAFQSRERRSKGGDELWGGERMVWDVEGCILTVRCRSSGLIYSSYRLTGRRWDVHVTVMETECTHGQWDTETAACETIRTWKSMAGKCELIPLKTVDSVSQDYPSCEKTNCTDWSAAEEHKCSTENTPFYQERK